MHSKLDQTQLSASRPLAFHVTKSGFLRVQDVLRLIPVGRSTLWEMIARGEFERPVKLTSRVSAWRCEDVYAYINARSIENLRRDNARGKMLDSSNLKKGAI